MRERIREYMQKWGEKEGLGILYIGKTPMEEFRISGNLRTRWSIRIKF